MTKFVAIGSNNEKGRALERIFGDALISLGYTDLIYNAYRTGEEIDIQGVQRVTNQPIKCQCKAHQEKIGSADLRLFLSDLITERDRNPETYGIFVSSSGFIGTAYRWYNELDDGKKLFFKIVNDEELFSILHDAELICSHDKLLQSIEMKTTLSLNDCSLILSERGVFWEIKLEDEDGEIHFMVLDGNGNPIKMGDLDYLLSKEQLQDKNYVSFNIKEKILHELLTTANMTLSELISKLDEPEHEIRATVANLSTEQIIEVSAGEIKLRNEVESFLGLTNYFKDSNNILIFMSSDYFKNNLESLVIPYIESKFLLHFTDHEKKIVYRLISVSPTGLINCLFGDSTYYKNTAEHLDQLQLEESEREKHDNQTRIIFIHKLARDLMIDIELNKNKDLLLEKDVVLILMSTEIALSKEFESFVKVKNDKDIITFVEIEGTVKAGQLMTTTSPGPLLKVANALSALREFDLAIKEYDNIIEKWDPNDEAVIAAIHNKRLIYEPE